MHKINLSVTASRTDVDNQFRGVITIKNEQGDEVSYRYLCTNPKHEEVDIEFMGQDDNFEAKGLPTKELFEKLSERQKLIFGLSIGLLSDTIDNSEKMLLSHDTTQMMRMFKADTSGKMEGSGEIADAGYQMVFGQEILDNKILEKINAKTGIPLRILKRAKYSSLLVHESMTLAEAKNAYIDAPEEGEKLGDSTLLRIVKTIIELNMKVEV